MKTFLTILLMLNTTLALAAFPSTKEVRDELNRSPYGQRVQLGTQLQDKKEHVLHAFWSFSGPYGTGGAANAVIDLLDVDGKKAVLPHGALITDCLIWTEDHLRTEFGEATISFSTGLFHQDLKVSGTTLTPDYAFDDRVAACIPVGTAATAIKLPSYSSGTSLTKNFTPTMKIGSRALLRGKLRLLIRYLLTN